MRINKEISSIWTAKELLNFAHARSTEFDLANVVTVLHRIAKSADRWQMKRDARLGKIVAQAVDAWLWHSGCACQNMLTINQQNSHMKNFDHPGRGSGLSGRAVQLIGQHFRHDGL